MNKGELIDAVAHRIDNLATKKDVDKIISATLDIIVETVASDEKVTLVGFGSFEPRQRKEREGRNPKTNEKMLIPASVVPAFSAGKSFRDAVDPKKK